jgi:hypothetical protein
MLFAKRNLKAGLFGLRSKLSPEPEEPLKPVAREERNALLGQPASRDVEEAPAMRNQTAQIHGPVQRLMGSLEQLNRYIIEAKKRGSGYARWCDAVMNELIRGVEISIGEGWTDVMEALTDTGRILQSYEDAKQAEAALPFLSESHEILVLMGGDLMIGPIRSGVMRKWRNHYQKAISTLEEADIALARDDDEQNEPTVHAKRPQVEAVDDFPNDFPFTAPSLTPLRSGQAEEPLPTLDELVPLGEPIEMTDASASEEKAAARSVPIFDDHRITPFPTRSEEPKPEQKPAKRQKKDDKNDAQGSFFEDLFNMSPPPDVEAPADVIHLPQERPATSPEVVSTLDAFCESLAVLERGDPEGASDAYSALLSHVARLQALAEGQNRLAAVELCHVLNTMCEQAAAQSREALDKFFELAYAFCGAYVDATSSPDDPAMKGWIGECRNVVQSWDELAAAADVQPIVIDSEPTAERPESIEEPAPIHVEAPVEVSVEFQPQPLEVHAAVAVSENEEVPAMSDDVLPAKSEEAPVEYVNTGMSDESESGELDEEDSTPEQLLAIAAQAISRGEFKNAKVFALQAAAGMARLEAAQAQTQLHEAELRLQKGAEAIQRARAAVQHAEDEVTESESRVSEGTSELDAQRKVTIDANSKVEEIDLRLKDLDEQIQKLIARREEEAAQLTTMQEVHAQARRREDDAEQALKRLKDAEQHFRIKLENTRQNVKALERRRAEVESSMEKARESLLEKRAAHQDIEQTLTQVRTGTSAGALPPEDLLF